MNITQEAIDTAAEELANRDHIYIPFAELSSSDRSWYRSQVYAVLNALSGTDGWEYEVTSK